MGTQEGDLLTDGMATAGSEGEADNQQPGGTGGNLEGSSVTDQSEGGDVPKFHAQFKDNLKGHPSLMKFNDPNGLAEGYVELERRLGRSVEMPGDDATTEDWSRFYRRLGRPETQEGYEFDDVELPNGVSVPEQSLEEYRNTAHKLGLTKAQANELYKWHTESLGRTVGDVKRAVERQKSDAERTLREEWGGEYDQNMELATRALRQFADDDFVQFVKTTGLGNHPAMSKVFAKIGSAIGEGSSPRGDGGPPAPTPQRYPGLNEI